MMNEIMKMASEKAKKIRCCPEWRELKRKWDGNIPHQGSKSFEEYKKDVDAAEKAIASL